MSKTPKISVLDMTLNYLIARLQFESFGESGVLFNYHYSQVDSDL